MIRIVLAICAAWSLVNSAAAQEVAWRKDYRAARKEATESQKLLLLDFTTSDCFWCKRLDATTYRNGPVKSLINTHFVPLKVNAEKYVALAAALNVESYPTIVLAASDGTILHRFVGYRDAAAFQAVLKQAMAAARAMPVEAPGDIRRVGYETVQPPSRGSAKPK